MISIQHNGLRFNVDQVDALFVKIFKAVKMITQTLILLCLFYLGLCYVVVFLCFVSFCILWYLCATNKIQLNITNKMISMLVDTDLVYDSTLVTLIYVKRVFLVPFRSLSCCICVVRNHAVSSMESQWKSHVNTCLWVIDNPQKR